MSKFNEMDKSDGEKVCIMNKHFNHQKTIGVIGAVSDSQAFILKAKQLGFETYLLCRTEEEASLMIGTTKTFVGVLTEEYIREEFLMACDLIVYYDETVDVNKLEEIQKTVIVPQGDKILSIAQDRVLQKTFLNALNVNIAPYLTVVKPEDIQSGIHSIGYPAVLKTNQVNPENRRQSYFIFDEAGIEEASELLKYGTCVLEPWITTEKELSVSAVKAANGNIQLFPIINKEYRNERLHNIQLPAELNQDLEDEIHRVTKLIFEKIDFQGVATIDFMVTPADALYVGTIYPYPNLFSRATSNSCSISATEAHLRAISSLPIPENIEATGSYVYVPFYSDQVDKINDLLIMQPGWSFSFYPVISKDEIETNEAIGDILIKTEDVSKVLSILKNGI